MPRVLSASTVGRCIRCVDRRCNCLKGRHGLRCAANSQNAMPLKSEPKEREKPTRLRNILAFLTALPFLVGAATVIFWGYIAGSLTLL